MAKNSLNHVECNEDSDEGIGVYDQGDYPGSQDDLSLPPIQLIQKYATSNNLYLRKMVARKVQELFRTVPADSLIKDLPAIMDILTEIANESMLKADLLEQVPYIALQATECNCSELKDIVSEYLIPLVVGNLGFKDAAVDKAAQSALILLIEQGFINKPQVEIRVCPSILALSKCEPEVITGSVTLMCKLAPLLGRDVTERVFLKRFAELCIHQQFLVRKVCSSHIGDFCAVVGKDAIEKILLPAYIQLCGDGIWAVRKASAEVIMFVSCASTPLARKTILAPAFVKLLQDECRWVRLSAFHTLGPFISTFANPTVTKVSYNSVGDLVLVNDEGNEFLMKEYLINKFLLSSNDRENAAVIMKDLFSMSKDSYDDEDTKEEAALSDYENKANLLYDRADSETDIKEIVETVKNAVLSCRTENPESKSKLINGNVINNDDIKQCDNLDSSLETFTEDIKNINVDNDNVLNNESDVNRNVDKCQTDIPLNIDNDKEANQVNTSANELEDDNLQLFNSYNYWYIKPEMPLDPDILNGLTNADDEMDVSSNLEDAYSKLNLSDSFVDSLDNTKIENWPDESSQVSINEKPEEEEEEEEVELEPQQDIVPQQLIDYFVYMTSPKLALTLDNEMTYHCAYSLPAVAVTLGNQNWNLLKKTVDCLAIDLQYKVRRTVASSLHELALILGPDVATENLTPLFDGFIKDLDEVRIGVLKHLAKFLKSINSKKRNTYLPRLEEFMQTDNESNWRFREELGNQLLRSVTLFRANDTAKYIGRIAQDLLCDKVAAVRQVAILLIIEVVKHISSEPGLTPHLLIKLAERFAHSKVWKRRQTYALLCCELLSLKAIPEEKFASEVMPHLLDLSWDPVANIRLVVARIISTYILTNEYFCNPKNQHYDGLQTVLKRLQADKDRDVRQSAVAEW
ncbi:unnamed protein product [Brassicogethes aeneus]|uniref:Serine/threonine-protein phosphatase 4 regulatory subunit 1 n=1 Tax=Brassicogethes aeneus TaxID=1431903 RepID=A0A9P0ASM0_BRAAE|nr:unnamed protein product [Brassicogethes aeneus]